MYSFTQPYHGRTRPASHASGHRWNAQKATVSLILTAVALAGCGGHTSTDSRTSTTTATSTTTTTKGGVGSLPGMGDPPTYWTTIQQQLAAGLGSTVTTLNQLWNRAAITGPKGQGGPAATTILDVATEHGLSVAQLRSVELGAIQQACSALVHGGSLTAQQASERMNTIRAWGQSDLDGYSMYAFQDRASAQ